MEATPRPVQQKYTARICEFGKMPKFVRFSYAESREFGKTPKIVRFSVAESRELGKMPKIVRFSVAESREFGRAELLVRVERQCKRLPPARQRAGHM